jgi:hypothetical protein
MTSVSWVSGMRYEGAILDWRGSRRSVMSHMRMWKLRLAVEVERHMAFHPLYLRRTGVFVVAAVVVGTTIEVAGPFVLVGTAMLLDRLATNSKC